MKSQALFILCLNLLAVSQTALGQSPATAQGESEGDLSGTWSVTVHLTTKEGSFLYTEAHDYTARMTFIPTTTAHYTASGHVNFDPKTDEEKIYSIYFQSCARSEGHDIAKTSAHRYDCSYEYGEANRYSDGTTTTIVYNGDLSFELNSGTVRGQTRFLVRVNGNATHSEEAEWTGERQADRQDSAPAQKTVDPALALNGKC
jgi:hypothetical protein